MFTFTRGTYPAKPGMTAARRPGGLLCTHQKHGQSVSQKNIRIVIISASLEDFRGAGDPNNAPGTYLGIHVTVRCSVEVGVRPLGEGVLAELLGGAVVLEGKLSVGIEELGNLHLCVCVFTNLTIDLLDQLRFILFTDSSQGSKACLNGSIDNKLI